MRIIISFWSGQEDETILFWSDQKDKIISIWSDQEERWYSGQTRKMRSSHSGQTRRVRLSHSGQIRRVFLILFLVRPSGWEEDRYFILVRPGGWDQRSDQTRRVRSSFWSEEEGEVRTIISFWSNQRARSPFWSDQEAKAYYVILVRPGRWLRSSHCVSGQTRMVRIIISLWW